MYKKIMVGFDGSAGARAALTRAVIMIGDTETHLSAVWAAPSGTEHGPHLGLTGANRTEGELKKQAVTLAATEQVPIQWDVKAGHAAAQIISHAIEERIDLVVLGTHGVNGAESRLLGGTTDRIAHQLPCDLLIVRRRSPQQAYRKILVGYDGSLHARHALHRAVRFAARLHATIRVLWICETLPHHLRILGSKETQMLRANRYFQSYIRQQVNAVAFEHLIRTDVDFLLGDPAQVLIEEAASGSFDLIVLGRSGHGVLYDKLLGGTADRVSHHAPCDVLLVRAPNL